MAELIAAVNIGTLDLLDLKTRYHKKVKPIYANACKSLSLLLEVKTDIPPIDKRLPADNNTVYVVAKNSTNLLGTY